MIERLQNQVRLQQHETSNVSSRTQTNGFGDLLQQKLDHADVQPQEVTFSKHAQSRAEERGIEITQSLIDQIKGGMIPCAGKGCNQYPGDGFRKSIYYQRSQCESNHCHHPERDGRERIYKH